MIRAPQKFRDLRKNQSGFTIIEVMIVLAVAATIMLIVFSAIPALQRNSRNTQRTSDATKISGGVNECLSNRNDQVGSCNTTAKISGVTLDTATLQRLTTVAVGANANGGVVAFPGDTSTAWVFFGQKCSTDGSNFAGGLSSQFVVLFNEESSSGGNVNRCVSGSG